MSPIELIIVAESVRTGRASMRLFQTFVEGNKVHGAGLEVGAAVGFAVGVTVGFAVGEIVGVRVGAIVGVRVGATMGAIVGGTVGTSVGATVGAVVGLAVGFVVGLGVLPGLFVGLALAAASWAEMRLAALPGFAAEA